VRQKIASSNVPRRLLFPAEFEKLGPDSVADGFESSFGEFFGNCPHRFGERLTLRRSDPSIDCVLGPLGNLVAKGVQRGLVELDLHAMTVAAPYDPSASVVRRARRRVACGPPASGRSRRCRRRASRHVRAFPRERDLGHVRAEGRAAHRWRRRSALLFGGGSVISPSMVLPVSAGCCTL